MRFTFPNHQGRLRPDMWVYVSLKIDLGERLIVPPDALLVTGERTLAYFASGGGRYEPREVRTGLRTDDAVEVISGLEVDERVVASANFFLDAESRIQSTLRRAAPGSTGMSSGHSGHSGDGQ